jgi:hypothetical protein
MGWEFKCGQMEPDMKDTGKRAKLQEKENLFMLMETYMKEIGKRIRLLVLVFTFTIMEQNTKVIGSTIISTALEYKIGLMEVDMKDLISRAKKVVKASTYGKMVAIITETGKITKSQDMGFIFGRMEENIKVNG